MTCPGDLWGGGMLALPDGSAIAATDGLPCPCGNARWGVWWDGRRYHIQCDGPRCCKPPRGGRLVGVYDRARGVITVEGR